jgi:hypothetical protein
MEGVMYKEGGSVVKGGSGKEKGEGKGKVTVVVVIVDDFDMGCWLLTARRASLSEV